MITNKMSRAHQSRLAIERLYVEMRYLINRGAYKPVGKSGSEMIRLLHELNPEIYGSLRDEEVVELGGLLYVFERLPIGIEECSIIKLISGGSLEVLQSTPIVPRKRRRNCYRIDEEQMFIEMTRGKSDVYDILTHITFLFNEAEKIGKKCLDSGNKPSHSYLSLGKIVENIDRLEKGQLEKGLVYVAELLGTSLEEAKETYELFEKAEGVNSLLSIVYHLGRVSINEKFDQQDREVQLTFQLRRQLGQHIYGYEWARKIKEHLDEKGIISHEIHIISGNMHSVMNTIYAHAYFEKKDSEEDLIELAIKLSKPENKELQAGVRDLALANGMTELSDKGGTNISAQIIEAEKASKVAPWLSKMKDAVIIVMDYAFGEQAYETMDELLKPLDKSDSKVHLNVGSINIFGKAGILVGDKGDIMLPDAYVFEGSADNYPLNNRFSKEALIQNDLDVYEGCMITVLGTSLQNKDVLRYFMNSSWAAIGLEMEGAHYQKAIQAASKIRKSISPNTTTRFAYYASDNPIQSGKTLASGSLGLSGIKPTYLITKSILEDICDE